MKRRKFLVTLGAAFLSGMVGGFVPTLPPDPLKTVHRIATEEGWYAASSIYENDEYVVLRLVRRVAECNNEKLVMIFYFTDMWQRMVRDYPEDFRRYLRHNLNECIGTWRPATIRGSLWGSI